ncbi:hypothetical protein P7K49_038836 [Saguinus oedipus]|uniref:Uncharacterized protein n=1 Tax=Saguinus oedipus TaxID=9490 RepID=A0ABQ9TFT2_SAGOE|nr:hypothetical protein P7K49_038836 [Saguinus oedipus]
MLPLRPPPVTARTAGIPRQRPSTHKPAGIQAVTSSSFPQAKNPLALCETERRKPDQMKTRIRRTSALVGSSSREGHVTREIRTPITTPISSAAGASSPLPSLTHQVLLLIFLFASPGDK